jgi:O-antigen ligase
VGGLLLVLALRRRGWDSWVFAVTGLAILALTASRTSQLAALAGVLLVLCLPWVLRAPRVSAPPRGIMAVAFVGVVALLLAPAWLAPTVLGPGTSDGNVYLSSAMTLTGRTTLWPVYVELWQSSPWTGLGASGIFEAIYSGVLPPWGSHAHNTYLDALTRNGVVAFVLVLAVFVVAALATLRDARRGLPVGLAIVGLLVVAGLGHTTIEWRYPEVPLVALILVVLMSGAAPGRSTVDESVASGDARQ